MHFVTPCDFYFCEIIINYFLVPLRKFSGLPIGGVGEELDP